MKRSEKFFDRNNHVQELRNNNFTILYSQDKKNA